MAHKSARAMAAAEAPRQPNDEGAGDQQGFAIGTQSEVVLDVWKGRHTTSQMGQRLERDQVLFGSVSQYQTW